MAVKKTPRKKAAKPARKKAAAPCEKCRAFTVPARVMTVARAANGRFKRRAQSSLF